MVNLNKGEKPIILLMTKLVNTCEKTHLYTNKENPYINPHLINHDTEFIQGVFRVQPLNYGVRCRNPSPQFPLHKPRTLESGVIT